MHLDEAFAELAVDLSEVEGTRLAGEMAGPCQNEGLLPGDQGAVPFPGSMPAIQESPFVDFVFVVLGNIRERFVSRGADAKLLGDRGNVGGTVVVAVPDLAIELPAAGHSDTAVPGIERGEVGELESDPIGVAEPLPIWSDGMEREQIQDVAQLDDAGIVVIEQSVAQVQIEGEDQFVSSPSRIASGAVARPTLAPERRPRWRPTPRRSSGRGCLPGAE